MAEDVGQAYVSIVPSLRGFSAKLKSELAGELRAINAPIEQAGGKAGRSFGDKLHDGIKSRLSGIAAMLKTGLVVGAAAAVAGLGALTVFGLKSAAALEQTTIGIEALTGSAEVAKQFLGELQQFAAKTPFEFSGVADASRRVLAFGQSVGIARDEVIPTLTTIGDLVSVLGGTQENVDSVIRALGQMASKGKVSQEEILQLAEALPGFNANAAIAASLGLPVSETLKLITAGGVDATTGINALLDGMAQFPGAAGAMEKQAGTLLGVFSTFKDTIGIALTNAFQPAIPAIKDALNELTPVMGAALDQLAPALGGVLTAVLPLIGQVVSALTPVLTPILTLLSGALQSFSDSGALQGVADAFTALLAPLAPLGPVLGQVAAALAGALAPLLTTLAPLIEAIAPALVELLTPLVPIIADVAGTLGAILGPAFKLLAEVIAAVSPFLSVLIKDFGDALKPILAAIAPIIGKVVDALLPMVPALVDILPSVLELVTAFTPLADLLAVLLTALLPLLDPILQLTAAWISFNAQKIVVPLIEKITDAMELLLEPVQALIEPLQKVGDWLGSLDWSGIATGIGETLSGAWQSVVDWFGDIEGKFGGVKDTITGAFTNAKDWLKDAGKDIINGLKEGAGGLLAGLGRWFLDKLPGWIVAPFKSALGIHSPSKVFAEIGEDTVAGYVRGLEDSARSVSGAMSGLVAPAANLNPTVGAGAPAAKPLVMQSSDPLWLLVVDMLREHIRRQFGGDADLALTTR